MKHEINKPISDLLGILKKKTFPQSKKIVVYWLPELYNSTHSNMKIFDIYTFENII